MTLTDLIYAAGFLDGEGSFIVTSSGERRVSIGHTYLPILEQFRSWFGGLICPDHRDGRHKPAWHWQVSGEAALNLCRRVYPFLREKKPQAALLLAYVREHRDLIRAELTGLKRAVSYPQVEP